MAERLGHEGPRCGVVPALALVDVEEDVDAPILLDAALEHAGGDALDELGVDDAIGGRPALQLPGFDLIHGENPVLQGGAITTTKMATRAGSESAAPEPG